jgi:deoxyribodipyrimidine photo-lyase
MTQKITLFWFRRDLRLFDNAALYYATRQNENVLPIFIFDKDILNRLTDTKDARVSFIHHTITDLKQRLNKLGSDLQVYYDHPLEAFQKITEQYDVDKVYTNHDYEVYAIERDEKVKTYLNGKNISFHTYKDQVIFEKAEVVKDDGKPYTVFTPYSRKWKARLTPYYLKSYPTEKYFSNLFQLKPTKMIGLEEMKFEKSTTAFPESSVQNEVIQKYSQQRDYPAIKGTSQLGLHLRFGTISIRQLATEASKLNETYLNELIWRDFYHQITFHFPHIGTGQSFKKEYDKIEWVNNEADFKKWCLGETGYPIVDAGMRQLNTTGFMHNRVRMIVASFLCKHLLIDWRWGEAYFAEKLLDFDFAANNGGWQWASSSGCDAAPYFRIFNPYLQTKKFDGDLQFIKKWVPEFEDFTKYPAPIVEHEFARKRCLETYAKALKS